MDVIYNESMFDTVGRKLIQNSIDLVITSPPYNTSRSGASDSYSSRYDMFEDSKDDSEYIDWSVSVFDAYDKVLKRNGCVLYNISYSSEKPHLMWLVVSNIIERTNFTTADCIIWKKKSALPNNVSSNKLTRIVEYVFVFARKSEIRSFYANKRVMSKNERTGQNFYENVYNYISAKNNDESTPLNKATFSSDLVCKLIDMYAPKGGLIYDSFMGTGTTAVACIKRDMSYVGSEISAGQCEYAEGRVMNARIDHMQKSLF
jgi:DNA modification methylase